MEGYTIQLFQDSEAGVWIATSKDIQGLVLEADSLVEPPPRGGGFMRSLIAQATLILKGLSKSPIHGRPKVSAYFLLSQRPFLRIAYLLCLQQLVNLTRLSKVTRQSPKTILFQIVGRYYTFFTWQSSTAEIYLLRIEQSRGDSSPAYANAQMRGYSRLFLDKVVQKTLLAVPKLIKLNSLEKNLTFISTTIDMKEWLWHSGGI